MNCSAKSVCVLVAGLIFFVVAIFYWAGWELGAIEAISLSILIGSSVDYCVHIVEGYILAGRNPPSDVSRVSFILAGCNPRQMFLR